LVTAILPQWVADLRARPGKLAIAVFVSRSQRETDWIFLVIVIALRVQAEPDSQREIAEAVQTKLDSRPAIAEPF